MPTDTPTRITLPPGRAVLLAPMVERVAWALAMGNEPFDARAWERMARVNGTARETFIRRARAAIQAMREPTPEMIAAALPTAAEQPSDKATTRLAEAALFLAEGPHPMDAGEHIKGLLAAEMMIVDWRAMVDAALRAVAAGGDHG